MKLQLKSLLVVCLVFTAGLLFAQASSAQDYRHVDPSRIVPQRPLSQALAYLQKYPSQFSNKNYLVIIDFTQHSSKKRFYLVNLKSGAVERFLTAHGSGSDTDGDGWATRFSNASGSNASSVGFYRTAETYSGKYGYSLRLQGLSSTNSNAYSRAIVVHGANYVQESASRAGRSWGCPAVDMKYRTYIIDRIRSGSLMYGWSGQ